MKSYLVSGLLFLLLLAGSMPATAQQQNDEPVPRAWDGQSRFTVLILGMDRRPAQGDSLVVRTDVMILASIDPVNQRIGLMHLPRDVHMTPPDSANFVRINTLLQDGESLQEGYGPYWVMDTLQYNLGMYIDRYVLFDFEAFITLVDAMGGIEVTVGYPINDETFPDMNYGFDPFALRPGTHLLNGYEALQFARTRHTDNDIMRGRRQMEVIQAVHRKLSEGRTFLEMTRRAPELLGSLNGNIYTDLALQEALLLARFAILVDEENIITGSLDETYTLELARPSGGRMWVPDRATVAELMINVFGPNYAQ
ncbi:MAG: LCP family protein [Chloroflexota bacterium]